MVLGSPKPEEIPLSWIQPGTTVFNCSHDFLSGKWLRVGARPLIKAGEIAIRKANLIQKEYVPEMMVTVNIESGLR